MGTKLARLNFLMWMAMVFQIAGCSSARTPSESDIRSCLGKLVPSNAEVEGLYGNMDVDSMIYRFRVDSAATQDEVETLIRNAAKATGWTDESTDNILELERVTPGDTLHSLENIRIQKSQDAWYYGCYVQLDLLQMPINRLRDSKTNDARWTREVLWQKLDSYVK